MKQTIVILFISILLVSCVGSDEALPTVDINAISTEAAEAAWASVTQTAGANIPTTAPTETPQAAETQQPADVVLEASEREWAKNFVGIQDSGGVTIEIGRVLVGYTDDIVSTDPINFAYIKEAETEVVGELVFKITNNSGFTVSVYPDQGSVQIGNEQIELLDYADLNFGDWISGEIYPGVTKIGGLWFGIRRSTPAEITQIIYRASAPANLTTYERLGSGYEIVIDVSQHDWEDYPDELE